MLRGRRPPGKGGTRLTTLLQYDDVITSVCERNGVDPELVRGLLRLEARYPNLHGWGQRPALRRDMAALVDVSLLAESPVG